MRTNLPEVIRILEAKKPRQTGALRAVMREILQDVAHESGREVLELANAIQRVDGYRYRIVSSELVACHKAAFALLNRHELERLGEGLDSWWSVDVFACELTGPAWIKGLIGFEAVEAWAKSPDVWWRRASLVSTVKPSRITDNRPEFIEATLKICEIHLDDREDTIVKALSWALRELGKKKPEVVEDFMRRYEARLAARIKREVHHKLTTGLKNPRKEVR